jgi:hypothetical protein
MQAKTPLREGRSEFPGRFQFFSLREGFNYFSHGSTDFPCNAPIKVKTLLREKQLLHREIQLLLCEQY